MEKRNNTNVRVFGGFHGLPALRMLREGTLRPVYLPCELRVSGRASGPHALIRSARHSWFGSLHPLSGLFGSLNWPPGKREKQKNAPAAPNANRGHKEGMIVQCSPAAQERRASPNGIPPRHNVSLISKHHCAVHVHARPEEKGR